MSSSPSATCHQQQGCRGILLFLLPRKKPAADAADLVDASKATNSAPLSAAGTLVSQLVQEIQRDVHAQKQSKSRSVQIWSFVQIQHPKEP